jgi:cold shock CspA family protein/ribosome-associated translation inhibitor RaiA
MTMERPLNITYRGVSRSEIVDHLIARKTAQLEKFCDHIIGCRVTVERPHRHERRANPYRVVVDMSVPPGHEVVVQHTSQDLHQGLDAVIRGAFKAAERRLKELSARQRGEVKVHEEPTGFVVRLFADEGYGFLMTPEGREIYFHRNAAVNHDFERLSIGTEVRFVESMGEKGSQASTIQVASKPGVRHAKGGEHDIDPPEGWKDRGEQ